MNNMQAYFKRGQCFYHLNNLNDAINDFSRNEFDDKNVMCIYGGEQPTPATAIMMQPWKDFSQGLIRSTAGQEIRRGKRYRR